MSVSKLWSLNYCLSRYNYSATLNPYANLNQYLFCQIRAVYTSAQSKTMVYYETIWLFYPQNIKNEIFPEKLLHVWKRVSGNSLSKWHVLAKCLFGMKKIQKNMFCLGLQRQDATCIRAGNHWNSCFRETVIHAGLTVRAIYVSPDQQLETMMKTCI